MQNHEKKIKVVSSSSNGQLARSEGSSSSTSLHQSLYSDRLSSLPDSILVSILSLLPHKDAALTSVLSHRWRYLWTQITRLNFNLNTLLRRRLNNNIKTNLFSYISAAHNIFQHLTSPKITTFKLIFPVVLKGDILRHTCASALEAWLGRVCSLNVEEIRLYDLYFSSDVSNSFVPIPINGFSCKWHSLVRLEIEGNFELKLSESDDGTVFFPILKILYLTISVWDCEVMATVFKSCPLLEQLELYISEECLDGIFINVSCPNLLLLTICTCESTKKGSKYVINTPRLEMLTFKGSVTSCLLFVDKPRSIYKAEIKLWKAKEDDDYGELSYLVQGISYVRSLKLNCHMLYPFIQLDGSTHPRLCNLAKLEICLVDTSVCENLLHCLRCAPNLEVLIIEFAMHSCGANRVEWVVSDDVPVCLSSKLTKIQVKDLEGSCQYLNLLEYFLSNGTVLEWLLVNVSSSKGNLDDESKFCRNLFGFARSSDTCIIQFRGKHLHALSTGFNRSRGTLDCQIQP